MTERALTRLPAQRHPPSAGSPVRPRQRRARSGTRPGSARTTRSTPRRRPATLSGLDSNQQLSLTDQLRSDIRSVELDAHWFPSLAAGGNAPVMCHARGGEELHAGCTTEALLTEGLRGGGALVAGQPATGRAALPRGPARHRRGLRRRSGCRPLSRSVRCSTHPAARAAPRCPWTAPATTCWQPRKQVLVVSSCHSGAGWNGTIFSEAAKIEDGPCRVRRQRQPATRLASRARSTTGSCGCSRTRPP